MRSKSIPIIVTSLLGAASLLVSLVPGPPATAPAPPTPVSASAPRDAQQVGARLLVLERQADDAGRAAQVADEALVREPGSATRAAVDRARSALRALAARQSPELARLATRLDVLGTTAPQAVRTTVALRGRTRALRALSFARQQIGTPYRFAGAGAGGFDCSGLTMRSYDAVRIGIGGHGATAQWRKAARQDRLVPYRKRHRGDLIFYGRPGAVYHVAIYAGYGRMIEAPYPGKRVREVPVRSQDRLARVARPTR